MNSKKLLFWALFLGFIPFFISAQDSPLECCTIKREIRTEGVTYQKGIKVGGEDNDCGIISACPDSGTISSDCYTSKWGFLCMLSGVKVVTDWIFNILVLLSALFVILGGFNITTAAGDPKKLNDGKNYILFAMIGFAIGLLSKAIPTVVQGLLE